MTVAATFFPYTIVIIPNKVQIVRTQMEETKTERKTKTYESKLYDFAENAINSAKKKQN